jgi:hypothetical protein
MVNFSDLELESYQSRNFLASLRKEMFPGWVLALPPRPQITSWGEGVVTASRAEWWNDDDDDDDDERMGEGGWWESMDGNEMSAVVVEDDDDNVLVWVKYLGLMACPSISKFSIDTTEAGEGDGHEFKWWDDSSCVELGDGVLVVDGGGGGERIGISLLDASLIPPNILL